MSQDSQTGKTGRAAPGERMKGVLVFLKREKVTDELLFTAEHAQQAAKELGMKDTEVWTTMRRLEKKGEFTLKKNKPGRGIIVTFNSSGVHPASARRLKGRKGGQLRVKQSNRSKLTVNGLLKTLDSEIQALEAQLQRKRVLRKEIASLAGRDS